MLDGVRMMPHEQFLLIRTKPYEHGDQTTPDDILRRLLTEHGDVVDAEPLVIAPENPSEECDGNGPTIRESVPAADRDDNDTVIVKSEPA